MPIRRIPSRRNSFYMGDALSIDGSWYAGLWAERLRDGRSGAIAHVWSTGTLEKVGDFVVRGDYSRPLASSTRLDLLLSADYHEGVSIYTVATGEEIVRICTSHIDRVEILDTERFAIVRYGCGLDIHALSDGKRVDTIEGVDKPLVPVQMGGRLPARMLASGGRGGDYRILNSELTLSSDRLAKHFPAPSAWAYHPSEPIVLVGEYPNCLRCISLDPFRVVWQNLQEGIILAMAFSPRHDAFFILLMTANQEYGTIFRVDAATGVTEPVSDAIYMASGFLVPDPLMLINNNGRIHHYIDGWFQEYAWLRIGPVPLIRVPEP